MSIRVSISGEGRVVKFYNLTQVGALEGIDIDIYDLNEESDIEEFFQRAEEFAETGEADILDNVMEGRGLDPEGIEEAVLTNPNGSEIDLEIDDMVLENLPLEQYVKRIKEGNIGDIIYIRSESGKATWDLSADYEGEEADPTNLKIAYFNCASQMDTYTLLQESFYEHLCDTLAVDFLTFENRKFELDDFIFEPIEVYGDLYVIKEDLQTHAKVIERISQNRRLIIGESEEI